MILHRRDNMSVVKDALIFYGKYQVAQTLTWAAANPDRAIAYTMAGTAAITNPTARSVLIKIGGHIARQAAKDALFYSKLIVTDVAAPLARSTAGAAKSAAIRAATTPAIAIPVIAVTAATAGGVASAAITTGINRQSNISPSDPRSMWSPFGGMQLGTVV
jgi:hypothetical protein